MIPVGDNKFAALNTSVWSGGSFIYVPKGVKVEIPLQAYFRINTENMGQFERTLIIVDEDAYVHYVEGCTAPIYSSDSLHSAVVEIIVKKGARCRYTTIQNWSNNVYNLVTKRAVAPRGRDHGVDRRQHRLQGDDEVPGRLHGRRARQGRGALGRDGRRGPAPGRRRQDGARRAAHVQSTIISKSIARGGGRTSYRGLVQVLEGSHHSRSTVKCDALLVDTISRSDTYPYVDIREDDVSMGHEATVSKISDDQLFYLMSRGMTEDEAMAMIVRGFIEPIAKELPMEYALELNRLIELQMEGRGRLTGPTAHDSDTHAPQGEAVEPAKTKSQACARTTSPTSRRSPAGRRSGGSPRSSACAASPTADGRRRRRQPPKSSTATCRPASPCPQWTVATPGSAAR